MKLLQYWLAALAFNISTVSFELSDKHYDYLERVEPHVRSCFILGIFALEEQSRSFDDSQLCITDELLANIIIEVSEQCEKSEFNSLLQIIHDLDDAFLSELYENLNDLEFSMQFDHIKTLCKYNCRTVPFVLISSCFDVKVDFKSVSLKSFKCDELIYFSRHILLTSLSGACFFIEDVNKNNENMDANEYVNDFLYEQVSCKEVVLYANRLGFTDHNVVTIMKYIRQFLSCIKNLKTLNVNFMEHEMSSFVMTDEISNKFVELCNRLEVNLNIRYAADVRF